MYTDWCSVHYCEVKRVLFRLQTGNRVEPGKDLRTDPKSGPSGTLILVEERETGAVSLGLYKWVSQPLGL